MQKKAYEYYQVDPWKIIEQGYDPKRNQVSESVFSQANEFMGVRGFFEEGVSAPSLIGSYFNGIYEVGDDLAAPSYKGIQKQTHFMVNAVNWLYTTIVIDKIPLDLAKANIIDFTRTLDMTNGLLSRTVTIEQHSKKITLTFKRLLDMTHVYYAYQTIDITVDADVEVEVRVGFDYTVLHWGTKNYWRIKDKSLHKHQVTALAKTLSTEQKVASAYAWKATVNQAELFDNDKTFGHHIKVKLGKGQTFSLEKKITHLTDKTGKMPPHILLEQLINHLKEQPPFFHALERAQAYWKKIWNQYDIEISGDPHNQQGIRYCIFQLQQTYQGSSHTNNIGAKGLTGEAYSGHTFWDTETYCLPFFLFNNALAAKHLLMYRYHTLEPAKKRAKQLDCDGACYPIATLNGHEGCTLWQHASLQFQPSTAVAYGIWHYFKHTSDTEFLIHYGFEMLLEVSRFLASRGQWNSTHTKFGFYAVMGPDEFQMMVNHNAYTNFMAKKTFDYTIEVFQQFRQQLTISKEIENDIERFRLLSKAMYITKNGALFEQHEGYFDLPHIDINQIPNEEFPLYHHWSYDRIYRNDMIKQPDVLMFMFLYNQDFTYEEKRINYEFYEPRTIHESSLSPSIHSIFAAELGKQEEALRFFGFATRMDLDDYNRNTSEGLHTTSIAAAWMNIIYGFGGFRSDGDLISFAPVIPSSWSHYRFKIKLAASVLSVTVNQDVVEIAVVGDPITCKIYQKEHWIERKEIVTLEVPHVESRR